MGKSQKQKDILKRWHSYKYVNLIKNIIIIFNMATLRGWRRGECGGMVGERDCSWSVVVDAMVSTWPLLPHRKDPSEQPRAVFLAPEFSPLCAIVALPRRSQVLCYSLWIYLSLQTRKLVLPSSPLDRKVCLPQVNVSAEVSKVNHISMV